MALVTTKRATEWSDGLLSIAAASGHYTRRGFVGLLCALALGKRDSDPAAPRRYRLKCIVDTDRPPRGFVTRETITTRGNVTIRSYTPHYY